MKISDVKGMNNAFWMKGPTDIAFSSALIYAGVRTHPEGHDVIVLSVRVIAYEK